MEQYFTSLSKRQTMLLLTSLAFGGSEAVNAYEFLDPAEEELLKHRAQSLLQIPRDKRIPLLVQEIKRLVTQRRRQLALVEPRRLAEVLQKERATTIEVVLNALPVELARAVRTELGNPAPVKLLRDVKPEVLSIIRWKLEDAMRSGAPQVGSFWFTDLVMMQQREVLAVADRMGARVLATAIAGLAEEERQGFLAKLPPDQRALASRAAEAGAARRLSEKDARLVLEMHGALENPSLGMRSAGVQRIARACIAQGGDFAQRFAERHQGDLGKLFLRWIREEKGKPIKADGGRLDIVEQLERLAQKGIVDRPMRLPPPIKPPPPVLAPARVPTPGPRAGPAAPARVLVEPPARRVSSGAPLAPRDPVAVRDARRAGAASGQVPSLQNREVRSTESQVRQRVLRDGKPLESNVGRQPGPLAQLPRRRDPAQKGSGPARSPVVKGPSGRGPTGGSR